MRSQASPTSGSRLTSMRRRRRSACWRRSRSCGRGQASRARLGSSSTVENELRLDGRGAIADKFGSEPPYQPLHRYVSVVDVRQQLAKAGAPGVLDHVGKQSGTEPAPLQIGADDEGDFRAGRPDPDDGGEAEQPAVHVERADGFDLAVIEPEQPAKSVAVAQRRGPAETPPHVLGMQEPSELHTTR